MCIRDRYEDKQGRKQINYKKFVDAFAAINQIVFCKGTFYTPKGAVPVQSIRREISNTLANMGWTKDVYKRQKENEAARIKEYLSYLLDGQKIETARNKISWRTSKQVHITDVSQVLSHEAYIKPRKYDESEINKTAVKEALQSGINVPGAELVTNLNLQIK